MSRKHKTLDNKYQIKRSHDDIYETRRPSETRTPSEIISEPQFEHYIDSIVHKHHWILNENKSIVGNRIGDIL